MAFRYELTYQVALEIDAAIEAYEQKFSSGAADFLTAFDDTIARMLKMPEAGKRRSVQDENIRGMLLEAEKDSRAYAKKFPFLLIYKVYPAEQKLVLFQLWHTRSSQAIRNQPDEPLSP